MFDDSSATFMSWGKFNFRYGSLSSVSNDAIVSIAFSAVGLYDYCGGAYTESLKGGFKQPGEDGYGDATHLPC